MAPGPDPTPVGATPSTTTAAIGNTRPPGVPAVTSFISSPVPWRTLPARPGVMVIDHALPSIGKVPDLHPGVHFLRRAVSRGVTSASHPGGGCSERRCQLAADRQSAPLLRG